MTAEVRAALRALPPVGENSSGPLGPGLLASGQLSEIIRDIQVGLAGSDRHGRGSKPPISATDLSGPVGLRSGSCVAGPGSMAAGPVSVSITAAGCPDY
jgi:hypothetical protein